MQVEFLFSIFSISRVMEIEPAVSPILAKYILLKWVVAYSGDLELFEQSQLLREFVDNSWEQPRIFLDDFEHVQLEDKFTSLFSFIFDHMEEIFFKCFSDVMMEITYLVMLVSKFQTNLSGRLLLKQHTSMDMVTDKWQTFLSHDVNKCV